MRRLFAVTVVASLALPTFAIAQGAGTVQPAPRGHRQPTAADAPDASSRQPASDVSSTTLPGTLPMKSGRSVKKGSSAGTSSIDDGSTNTTPSICSNCDD